MMAEHIKQTDEPTVKHNRNSKTTFVGFRCPNFLYDDLFKNESDKTAKVLKILRLYWKDGGFIKQNVNHEPKEVTVKQNVEQPREKEVTVKQDVEHLEDLSFLMIFLQKYKTVFDISPSASDYLKDKKERFREIASKVDKFLNEKCPNCGALRKECLCNSKYNFYIIKED